MQHHQFVNTKGFTLEQAIMSMHAALEKLRHSPETSNLEIHTVNFVNTFEKPQKSSLDLNGNNQPVIVYNCCIMLVEPKAKIDVESIMQKYLKMVGAIPNLSVTETDHQDDPGPSENEIKDLKEGAAFVKRSEQLNCAHLRLGPEKHSKAYRNPGQYYQTCLDCGSEVWQGITDEHPAPGAGYDHPGGKMFVVPGDPGKDDHHPTE